MAAPWERNWSGTTVLGSANGGGLKPEKVLDVKKAFSSNPVVDAYRTQVPVLASAASAPQTPAGDLDLIYAAGKILDPGSVVREGEMAMVGGTAPFVSQIVGRFSKEFQDRGQLSPKTRQQLVGMLSNRVAQSARAYNAQRRDYSRTAQSLGLDPSLVVGPHPGDDLVRAGLANRSGSGLSRGMIGAPFIVKSMRDYEALPPGARYIDPKGNKRTKGAR